MMQRVARVLIKVDDAKLQSYATEEEETVEEIIKSFKDDFEGWLETWKQHLGADMEFIEWEDFCPKCESTDLRLVSSSSRGFEYFCRDCEHAFTIGRW